MNETETSSPLQNDLMDQMVALRHQVFTLLLALVVVSGTLTVFLYRQASLAGKDIAAVKPQVTQMLEAFKRDQQGMENFVKQLTAYGVTHPDFQPILKKYGLVPPPAGSPVVPPGTPGAPVTPKK
jgi:hypothetical protein